MVIEANIDTIDHQTLMMICDVHVYLDLYTCISYSFYHIVTITLHDYFQIMKMQ